LSINDNLESLYSIVSKNFLMKTLATGMILTIAVIALLASGLAVTGQISKVFSQTNESNNMSAMSSNASSMEANITGSNANDTGMGAPHASNMTAEKVLAPNGTAPS
jgi:hypothetical protein